MDGRYRSIVAAVSLPPRDARDDWMRRLGPLYPAMVALGCLTRVPLPRGLEPAPEDLARSAPWFPIVGGALGVLLAGVAAVFTAVGLVPAIAGVLALMAGLVITGGMLEVGLAETAEAAASSARPAPGERERRLAGVLAVSGLLTLRALGLLGTDTDAWLAGLAAAAMIARWCPLMLALVGSRLGLAATATGTDRVRATLVPAAATPVGTAVASVVTVVAATWLGRGAGLLSVLVGLAVYAGMVALSVRWSRSARGPSRQGLAAAAALSELAVLLVFAAAHPAVRSPWVVGGL
jgi:adenosylcobinamide-GDP ribazoletransferase